MQSKKLVWPQKTPLLQDHWSSIKTKESMMAAGEQLQYPLHPAVSCSSILHLFDPRITNNSSIPNEEGALNEMDPKRIRSTPASPLPRFEHALRHTPIMSHQKNFFSRQICYNDPNKRSKSDPSRLSGQIVVIFGNEHLLVMRPYHPRC